MTEEAKDCTCTADTPEPTCPECGGEIAWAFAKVTGIDTAYLMCLECDWTGEPE